MRASLRLLLAALIVLLALLAPAPTHAQSGNYTDLFDFYCGNQANTCYPGQPAILAQGTDGNFYGMACDTYSFCSNGSIFQMTPTGLITVLHVFNTTSGTPGLTLGPDGNFYGVTGYGGTSDLGTIFQITPGGVLTTLHSFNGNDGSIPLAPPVVGDDGFLYGTALNYGYKISTTGAFTLLTSSIPYYASSMAPLLLASDGSFYGTVYTANTNGGAYGGTIFRMSPGGTVSVLYNFQPDSGGNYFQGEYPYGGLTQGPDGMLYGTTAYGGAYFPTCSTCGVVFQMSTKGTIGWEYSFTGLDDGSLPYAGLITGSDGNLYGVTSATGGNGSGAWGTFFSLTTAGQFNQLFILTANCSAGSCLGARPFATPMQATDGNLYGLTNQGGIWNAGVFYQLNVGLPPVVTTIQPSGKVGDTVGILGQNFSTSSIVKFNGVTTPVISATTTYLTAKIPAGATTGNVSVDGVSSAHKFRIRLTTTTALASSGSPSLIGQPVTFTATVTPKKGVVPDGELVTFLDGAKIIGSTTTSGGIASFTTSSLAVSTKPHTIKATYEGDGSLVASTGTVSQTVQLYPTSAALASSLNPSNFGQAVTLTAQVTSSAPAVPTGTVTFKNGNTTLGTATVNSSGTATLNTTKMPVGTDSIIATYNGDSLNAKSSSALLQQTVNQAQITIKVTSSPNPSTVGQSVTFTARLASNGGLPTGELVTFSYNGTTLGTATIAAGKAIFSTTSLPQGSDVVTATYAGSANYSAASASVTQKVN